MIFVESAETEKTLWMSPGVCGGALAWIGGDGNTSEMVHGGVPVRVHTYGI